MRCRLLRAIAAVLPKVAFLRWAAPEALLFGGFVPRDPKLAAALTEKALPIPSLHYSGKQDELVIESRSLELFECFDEGTRSFETHPQGHCIPSLREVRERVKAYVNTVVPDPNVS